MIAALFGWGVKMFGGGFIDKVVDTYTKSQDTAVKGKEIEAGVVKDALHQYVELHKVEATKWSLPWFPLMAAPFIISIGVFFMLLTTYNILWHPRGIFPQTWTIAAYPGVYQGWATQAFNWVFAPAMGLVAIKSILGKK